MRKNIFKAIVTVAGIVMSGVLMAGVASRVSLTKDTYSVKANEVASKTDRLVGMYVTYGAKNTNESQDIINKKQKVYADIQDKELVFEGLKGAYITIGLIDNNGNINFEDYMRNKTMCCSNSVKSETSEEIQETTGVKEEIMTDGTVFINSNYGGDLIVYGNPIYMSVDGKVYVTDAKAKKMEITSSQISEAVSGMVVGDGWIDTFRFSDSDYEIKDNPSDTLELNVDIQVEKESNDFYVASFNDRNFGNEEAETDFVGVDLVKYTKADVEKQVIKDVKKAQYYTTLDESEVDKNGKYEVIGFSTAEEMDYFGRTIVGFYPYDDIVLYQAGIPMFNIVQ